jgi:hypothetical protein
VGEGAANLPHIAVGAGGTRPAETSRDQTRDGKVGDGGGSLDDALERDVGAPEIDLATTTTPYHPTDEPGGQNELYGRVRLECPNDSSA